MSIRIGSSWVLSPSGVDGYVSEVRRHWYENPYWDYKNAIKKCIDNNIYLIFNQCLGYNKTAPHPEYLPTESEWRSRIEENVQLLKSYGGNKYNCRLSLINEPTKFFRVENGYRGVTDLIDFVNIAHDQIAGRFELGAGNMEFYDSFVLGNWYKALCEQASFEWLDIHIQNSCDTYEHTRQYMDYSLNLANQHNKKLSCTEAMHTGWDMASSDYLKLLMQLNQAERGCTDFCVICLNLDTQAAGQEVDLSQLGQKPCFRINGVDRSNGHYADLMGKANQKHPIPNIYIPPEEDMILDKLYKLGSKGIGVRFIQKILNEDIIPEPLLITDGIWGSKTADIVKQYQTKYDLQVDGIVGPQTMKSMIEQRPWVWNEINYEWAIGVR